MQLRTVLCALSERETVEYTIIQRCENKAAKKIKHAAIKDQTPPSVIPMF